jgi:hypothetical protein
LDLVAIFFEVKSKKIIFLVFRAAGGNMGPIKYGVPTTRKFPKLAII